MRSLAALATALALLAAPLALPLSPARAQAGDGPTIGANCQQLVCQFEVADADAAVEGNATAVEWTFGPNGTNATGNPVEHAFPEPGTYEVQVTVTGTSPNATDNATANATGDDPPQASATRRVTVEAGSVPWSALGVGVVALAASIGLARVT